MKRRPSPLQPVMADLMYGNMVIQRRLYERLQLPVISTARPLDFYRRVFFDNQTPDQLRQYLHGKHIADIGCGLTPYVEDSMFQWCRSHGITFYGVDPKIGSDFRFNVLDRVRARLSGSSGRLDRDAPGHERAISAYAHQLPFGDGELDIILSSWLLFAWIDEPQPLAAIFNEFHRVLKPGGSAQLFPMRAWSRHQSSHPAFRAALARFRVEQTFVSNLWGWMSVPSYMTRFTRLPD